MTRIRLFLFIIAILAPSLAAAQQSMKFEEAGAMLAASCGKDIDDNCRGVNFDATRLRECLSRNQDVVSAKCKADFPDGARRHPAAHHRAHLACQTLQLGIEATVRRGAGGSRQGSAMPAGIRPRRRPRTATRRSAQRGIADAVRRNKPRGIALLLAALALFALPMAAGRAQTADVERRHHRETRR